MPTILSQGKIRYCVYPGDHNPPHVHVIRDDAAAVIDMSGVVLKNDGFLSGDLKDIVKTVIRNRDTFQAAWEAYNA